MKIKKFGEILKIPIDRRTEDITALDGRLKDWGENAQGQTGEKKAI